MNAKEEMLKIVEAQEKIHAQQRALNISCKKILDEIYSLRSIKSFMKVKQAAREYQIGRSLIYKAIENGELKCYKPNSRDFLISTDELVNWIKTSQHNPK